MSDRSTSGTQLLGRQLNGRQLHGRQQSAYGVLLSYLDEHLRELEKDSSFLLKSADIDDVSLIQPGQRIPFIAMARACERVYRHPHLRGFFLDHGARVTLTVQGNLGLALLSASNIESAVEILDQYSDIALPNLHLEIVKERNRASIEFSINTPFTDFNTAIAEALSVTLLKNLSFLIAKDLPLIGVEFIHSPPDYEQHYADYFDCPISFSAAQNRLVLPHDALTLPFVTANQFNLRFMLQQCDLELKQIYQKENLVERVRAILLNNLQNCPTIASVANKLAVSERTLRRRLSEESISFRELLKSIRHDMAKYYLRESNYRIDQIATKTGYQDTASFRAAFKKQTDLSPLQWRQQSGLDEASKSD